MGVHITYLLDGQPIGAAQQPLESPLTTARVTLTPRGLLTALWRGGSQIVVQIGADPDTAARIGHALSGEPMQVEPELSKDPLLAAQQVRERAKEALAEATARLDELLEQEFEKLNGGG